MTTLFADLVAAGLSCVPVRLDGSKAPALASWKDYQSRLPNADEVASWGRQYAAAGVVAGAVSANLEIIDLDDARLVRPFLESVRQQAPSLFERLTVHRTPRRNENGSAGAHVAYRCTEPVAGNQKLAMGAPEPELGEDGRPVVDELTGKPRLTRKTFIETRGQGGYVVVPGSDPRVHDTGRPYEHARGPRLPEIETISGEERELLLRTARTFDQSPAEAYVPPKVEGYKPTDRRPGDEYASRVSWADILCPAGWVLEGEAGGTQRWRRPGKNKGWSATTGLTSKQGTDLLCVFSSNAFPFPGPDGGHICSTHGKFDAYALLHHGGDHRAAATALAQKGFGDAPRKQERKERVLARTMLSCELELIDRVREGKGRPVPLGIEILDEALEGGVEPGEVVLIGGKTSHGKTDLCLQFARARLNQRENVIIVSEEMTGRQLARRSIEARTRLPYSSWQEHAEQLRDKAFEHWKNQGIEFVLHQCREMDALEKSVESIISEYPITMIAVDYAQLLKGAGNSRYEQISDVSSRFGALIKRHNAIGVLLAQFNREGAKGTPDIFSFKDSSQLEHDADVVLLCEWLSRTDPKHPDPREYVLKIQKNRNRARVHLEVSCQYFPEFKEIRSGSVKARPETPRTAAFDQWNDGNRM